MIRKFEDYINEGIRDMMKPISVSIVKNNFFDKQLQFLLDNNIKISDYFSKEEIKNRFSFLSDEDILVFCKKYNIKMSDYLSIEELKNKLSSLSDEDVVLFCKKYNIKVSDYLSKEEIKNKFNDLSIVNIQSFCHNNQIYIKDYLSNEEIEKKLIKSSTEEILKFYNFNGDNLEQYLSKEGIKNVLIKSSPKEFLNLCESLFCNIEEYLSKKELKNIFNKLPLTKIISFVEEMGIDINNYFSKEQIRNKIKDLSIDDKLIFHKIKFNVDKYYLTEINKLLGEACSKMDYDAESELSFNNIKKALESGANPNFESDNFFNGYTPLYWAVMFLNVKTVKLLLDYGADPKYKPLIDLVNEMFAMNEDDDIKKLTEIEKLLVQYGAKF